MFNSLPKKKLRKKGKNNLGKHWKDVRIELDVLIYANAFQRPIVFDIQI